MNHSPAIQPSGTRFSVEYHLSASEAEARANAEALCFDQTVELPDVLVPTAVREQVVGRMESFRRLDANCHEAVISFPSELLTGECTQLLNVVFGIASLKPGIRVARLHLPDPCLQSWPGPRFGRDVLRALVNVHHRPLVCGVLKPLGLSVSELADLAYQFALGGLDLVKDDQGLSDQRFCPFEERVARCVEAVAKANLETGRRCLYVPHVTGPWEAMRTRCLFAKKAGAGGLLICPGLTGFDSLRGIAQDDAIALPILSHPAFLGGFMVHADSGIAPSVLFGQLPRLFGADVSIYPSFGGSYAISPEDCRKISTEARNPWGHLKPMFPTAAGRINAERVSEMGAFYEQEVIIILGSGITQLGADVIAACKTIMDLVARGAQAE
ncbi:MAG: RuBisCO large subunit C-terminal-like domain-containing protein [Nitrospiraceae bacterium]